MPEEAVSEMMRFPELELVDRLLSSLEGLIQESDETPLSIEAADKPRKAVYRILSGATPSEKKSFFGDAIYLDERKLVLRCNNTVVVRFTPLEVMVQAEKSGRGETTAIINGKATDIRRVRGGYDIDVDVTEMRKLRTTPSQKLRECVDRSDPSGWNRWCQDIRDAIELMGMDLRNANLGGYDLCCADLSGSDLTGANLTGAILAGADLSTCIMDKVTVANTDFFRASMNREQASLLSLSGMPEVESVIFEE